MDALCCLFSMKRAARTVRTLTARRMENRPRMDSENASRTLGIRLANGG